MRRSLQRSVTNPIPVKPAGLSAGGELAAVVFDRERTGNAMAYLWRPSAACPPTSIATKKPRSGERGHSV